MTCRRLVADNYSSVTQKSFRPYSAPTGNEPLPYSTAQTGSGYIRQKNLTIPSSAEVGEVDTSDCSILKDMQLSQCTQR